MLRYKTRIEIGEITTFKVDWDDEQLKMKKIIRKGGYNPKLGKRPMIDINGNCVDGNHRVQSLQLSQDPKKRITVTLLLFDSFRLAEIVRKYDKWETAIKFVDFNNTQVWKKDEL